MRKIILLTACIIYTSLSFGQNKEEMTEFISINTEIIDHIITQINRYDSTGHQTKKLNDVFIKSVLKNFKTTDKLFKKKMKLVKRYKKKKEGNCQAIFDRFTEDIDNANRHYNEAIYQIDEAKYEPFDEWMNYSMNNLDKTISDLKMEIDVIQYHLKKQNFH